MFCLISKNILFIYGINMWRRSYKCLRLFARNILLEIFLLEHLKIDIAFPCLTENVDTWGCILNEKKEMFVYIWGEGEGEEPGNV